MNTTIRLKIRDLINLFFYLYTTIRLKIRDFINLIFYLYTTIPPKIRVPIDLIFFICTRPFDQNWGISLIQFFYLYRTLPSKIRVLINLIISLVHDHSTKVRGHSYSLTYHCLSCANIWFAIFMEDTALIIFRVVRYVHGYIKS